MSYHLHRHTWLEDFTLKNVLSGESGMGSKQRCISKGCGKWRNDHETEEKKYQQTRVTTGTYI
jgi:hypothetical protein